MQTIRSQAVEIQGNLRDSGMSVPPDLITELLTLLMQCWSGNNTTHSPKAYLQQQFNTTTNRFSNPLLNEAGIRTKRAIRRQHRLHPATTRRLEQWTQSEIDTLTNDTLLQIMNADQETVDVCFSEYIAPDSDPDTGEIE